MGMSQMVRCPDGVPGWARVVNWLAERGLPVQMRMIDGQLALPDELPGPMWKELRVSMAAGMVTIRRQDDVVELTIWGNADPALQDAGNLLAVAYAETGSTSPK
jgi:hypothetical protein